VTIRSRVCAPRAVKRTVGESAVAVTPSWYVPVSQDRRFGRNPTR
jgi:hypothetical protein